MITANTIYLFIFIQEINHIYSIISIGTTPDRFRFASIGCSIHHLSISFTVLSQSQSPRTSSIEIVTFYSSLQLQHGSVFSLKLITSPIHQYNQSKYIDFDCCFLFLLSLLLLLVVVVFVAAAHNNKGDNKYSEIIQSIVIELTKTRCKRDSYT